jgi:putative transposase
MANRAQRQDEVNRQDGQDATEVAGDQLEEFAGRGDRQMLLEALDEEVEGYLQRGRYRRREDDESFRGYRNGTFPRRLTLGSGTMNPKVPRVRDIPDGQDPYGSRIIRKYQRRSDTIDETFLRLFLEGLATRDFEPALRLLMGSEAPLSASVISRLTQRFKERYETFDRQDFKGRTFVYIWADGIYLKAGIGTENRSFGTRLLTCLATWGVPGTIAC